MYFVATIDRLQGDYDALECSTKELKQQLAVKIEVYRSVRDMLLAEIRIFLQAKKRDEILRRLND